MDQTLLLLAFLITILVAFAAAIYFLNRRSAVANKRASHILTSIEYTDEEMDAAEQEIREIKSHQRRIFRISGFKWILSVVFTLILLFLATFEFWVDYYPAPKLGRTFPITLRAAYSFSLHKIYYSPTDPALIERGKIITPRDLELIQAYETQKQYPSVKQLFGYYIIFQILTLMLVFWLTLFFTEHPEDENKNLTFIFLVILLVLMVAKFSALTSIFPLYYVPLSMVAILLAILIFNRIVPSVIIFASLLIAIVCDFDTQVMVVLFGGGMVTIFWLQNVKKRSQVLSAGLVVGITNLIIYISIILMKEGHLFSSAVKENATAALLNGVISSFLALLLIPIFEKIFGYLSPFRLMELSDLDSVLLRELYLKAPGTYHHSLSVANLAEIAANEIGANALLLRVGAYYHDIGKMFKPNYFVENLQTQGENPHDRMPPFASAKILKSHIVLGMQVGKKFGLPRKVLDLIPQHHGTTVMDYFYEKAKTNPETIHISERYFAYPGPRPRSKEAAILMIVDSVEAASRVLSDHSEETVRKMIEKLIHHKLEQRQLDDAGRPPSHRVCPDQGAVDFHPQAHRLSGGIRHQPAIRRGSRHRAERERPTSGAGRRRNHAPGQRLAHQRRKRVERNACSQCTGHPIRPLSRGLSPGVGQRQTQAQQVSSLRHFGKEKRCPER
jgi:putative nucleotidyltransferase with HDIG domain